MTNDFLDKTQYIIICGFNNYINNEVSNTLPEEFVICTDDLLNAFMYPSKQIFIHKDIWDSKTFKEFKESDDTLNIHKISDDSNYNIFKRIMKILKVIPDYDKNI